MTMTALAIEQFEDSQPYFNFINSLRSTETGRNERNNTFTIFRDLRNITVKEGKLEFKRRINIALKEQINITDTVGFIVIRKGEVIKESKPEEPPIRVKIKARR